MGSGQIDRGRSVLADAHSAGRLGPYQLQAAIAALHASAPSFETTDWGRIIGLYDVLVADPGDAVSALNRAAAIGHGRGAACGLAALEQLSDEHLDRLADYPYFHACLGEFRAATGDVERASDSLTQAIELTRNAPERNHLAARLKSIVAGDGDRATGR